LRLVFFYWEGSESSINDKGTAALMSIDIDQAYSQQIRVRD
jgi:hypothetical protein